MEFHIYYFVPVPPYLGPLRSDLSDLAFWDVEEGSEDTTLDQNLRWGFVGGGIAAALSLWVCPAGVVPSEASPPGWQIS